MAIPISLPLLILPLLTTPLQPTLGAELLSSVCLSPSSSLTSPTQYAANVHTLLKILASQSTLASTGFAKGSAGRPNTQRAYGLVNCHSDATSEDCKACAHDSARAALSLCPGIQGAILWYDTCLLKYSDANFLGRVDTDNRFSMSSPVSVSGDPTRFNARVKNLLTKLSKRAVTDPKLSAMGKASGDANTTAYGMVECTRDLSSGECGSCLDVVVGEVSNCCSGLKGGRVISASCMFRFEIYPF